MSPYNLSHSALHKTVLNFTLSSPYARVTLRKTVVGDFAYQNYYDCVQELAVALLLKCLLQREKAILGTLTAAFFKPMLAHHNRDKIAIRVSLLSVSPCFPLSPSE